MSIIAETQAMDPQTAKISLSWHILNEIRHQDYKSNMQILEDRGRFYENLRKAEAPKEVIKAVGEFTVLDDIIDVALEAANYRNSHVEGIRAEKWRMVADWIEANAQRVCEVYRAEFSKRHRDCEELGLHESSPEFFQGVKGQLEKFEAIALGFASSAKLETASEKIAQASFPARRASSTQASSGERDHTAEVDL